MMFYPVNDGEIGEPRRIIEFEPIEVPAETPSEPTPAPVPATPAKEPVPA